MAQNLKDGEQVYVPVTRLGLLADAPSAFHKTTVRAVEARSVIVDIPGGGQKSVASSAVHRDIGVLIVRIGDFQTEETLLDPLTKSILQFSRVLVTDAHVRRIEIRSKDELQSFWRQNHRAHSHVVIVGHGYPDGLKFGVDGNVSSDAITEMLDQQGVKRKLFILLTCEAGQRPFASSFSQSNSCEALIAPFSSVHGAESSLFCQALLTNHLLKGQTFQIAFNHASSSLQGNKFRLWRRGKLVAGYHSK